MTPSKRVGKPFFLCQAWGALHIAMPAEMPNAKRVERENVLIQAASKPLSPIIAFLKGEVARLFLQLARRSYSDVKAELEVPESSPTQNYTAPTISTLHPKAAASEARAGAQGPCQPFRDQVRPKGRRPEADRQP